ncbi:MAG: YifB family Mg chelatase-like AAA ATPase [Pseudomonadota bacterium]
MSLATVYSRAQNGIEAPLVSVEVHLSNGLPRFSIVGLPEAAVKESKDRVRAALLSSNFDFPARRITVNLAPAELPKQGGRFDLPIALGLLVATKQLNALGINDYEFLGELGLNGELRKTVGILPAAYACHLKGSKLITSIENEDELEPIQHAEFFCANHLLDVCAHLNKIKLLVKQTKNHQANFNQTFASMNDVQGQARAKRALTIAAAGHHHVLMVGSPGSGKTMLASRFPSLLSLMSEQETLETCSLYSISNSQNNRITPQTRPFRRPHHTVSPIGLAGGGSIPKPGEISLAHNGVLFLDEFTEFTRQSLEILREPIETGKITISRAAAQVEFPARFQLIAAMNPCQKGCDIDEYGQCECSQEQLTRYRNKLSAPLLDRIDLQINVPKIPSRELFKQRVINNENWDVIKNKISQARNIQIDRQSKPNAMLEGEELNVVCDLDNNEIGNIIDMLEHLKISARAFHKILKVARTIADLEGSEKIVRKHIAEAVSYRQLDKLLNI